MYRYYIDVSVLPETNEVLDDFCTTTYLTGENIIVIGHKPTPI